MVNKNFLHFISTDTFMPTTALKVDHVCCFVQPGYGHAVRDYNNSKTAFVGELF